MKVRELRNTFPFNIVRVYTRECGYDVPLESVKLCETPWLNGDTEVTHCTVYNRESDGAIMVTAHAR